MTIRQHKKNDFGSLIWSILILLLSVVTSFSQTTEQLNEILSAKLEVLAENIPLNLVYIQTSKGIYERGEDLWFKTYELDAQFLEPSDLSKTLYLQMVSEKSKQVIWQEKYEMVNGFAEGHVYLEDTLSTGTYILFASTAYAMPPATNDFHAIRKIRIIDNIRSFRENQIRDASTGKLMAFNVFPEAGNLVDGLPSRVAFKAVDEFGQPFKTAGVLYQNDEPMLDFKSVHAGMGSFNFVPNAKDKYYIKIDGAPNDSIFLLPKVFEEGITMKLVEKRIDKLVFSISRSNALLNEQLYFRLQMRGTTYGLATVGPGKTTRLVLPLHSFPQGIAECTIFNEHFEALTERLIFVNSDKKIHISASLGKEDQTNPFSTREKVNLKIKVRDKDGNPLAGNFGISIYEKQFKNLEDPKNIFTHFYLST